ncbi:hypothetical protein [Blastococcus sp. LR1]|uniref:hypothetical protein n=1 Tax=Blastococcus sp. LR1 TaxID=2877000 RepID=UPI001CCCBC84|nr:hypothetical protein [Blastococcus sp. LR1]MCA0144609.1 hypothetical protein [Blastococcus sp. LR1]
MTRAGTMVRLRSAGADDPRVAAATVTARPGEVVLEPAGAEQRVLRVGTDVVAVRWDAADGGAGRAAFLGPDKEAVAVLELGHWTPPLVRVAPQCRGGSEDPVEWTGLQQLAATAGLPLERGRIEAKVDFWPAAPRVAFATKVSMTMSLLGVLWFVAFLLTGYLPDPRLAPAALALTTICAAVLCVEQALRRRRGLRVPAGDDVSPRPSVPVSRRFRRVARLVLTPATGPVDVLVVRDRERRQTWLDGPNFPLGAQRAVVVTPPGADRPERVDLLDGLGRAVVRLPWEQWFGDDDGQLDVFRRRGIPVERAVAPGLGRAAELLLVPRSGGLPLDTFEFPGGLGLRNDASLAAGVGIVPLVVALRGYESTPTLLLGLVNCVLLFGPVLARAAATRWLDVAR